jgi:hypothetical protein
MPALNCAVKAPFFYPLPWHVAPGAREDAMPLDLKRLFPMEDLPSARLMRLKAFCLFRARVLTDEEKTEIVKKADTLMQHPRFRSALHPRRAA